MKSLLLTIALCLCLASSTQAQTGTAVSTTTIPPAFESPATDAAFDSSQLTQIEGVVTVQGKYSFKVKSAETEYTIKLAKGAPIGLKMNKPWYDWKNNQVVVDAIPFPADAESKASKRVAIKFPSEQMYLISRFSDKAQMDEVMDANIKRLNFYLVTPEDPGPQMPSNEKPFIAGALSVQKNQVRLKIEDTNLPIKLGFRFATMNGFSITELKAQKTQVFLTGIAGKNENEIIASRVLFQPIESK